MHPLSERSQPLKQSGIRAASVACAKLGGINLGQGVCDLPVPEAIQVAAYQAIQDNHNQYSACEGAYRLREALAQKIKTFNQVSVCPEAELMVTHGATGAFVSAAMTLFNPGDEVILFEPFYGYHQNILNLLNVAIKTAPLSLTDFSFDMEDLERQRNEKTKAIVICTPCNPLGKVFSKEELCAIGDWAKEHDLWILTDEIYEYVTYPGAEHVSMASLKDFKERTLTISGFSKTYNMTGWRLGSVFGPKGVIEKMALVQDFLYVCPATPLQHAVLTALALDETYYQEMQALYLQKRDKTVAALRDMGFQVTMPEGAYYLMADFSDMHYLDDVALRDHLLQAAKVATVPGRAFYQTPGAGEKVLRFCYALREEKVDAALAAIARVI